MVTYVVFELVLAKRVEVRWADLGLVTTFGHIRGLIPVTVVRIKL